MPKLEDIIHIGYPKTASTWFQEKFYPFVENITYLDRQQVQKELLIPGAFEWQPDSCKKKLLPETGRIAICEELLLGRLRAGGVKHFLTKEIANRIKQLLPEGQVVIFLRNQQDALASSYLEYIKSGGNYGISKFLYPNRISEGDFNPLVLLGVEYFNYLPVVDYYSSLFGKENVHLYLYEDFKEAPDKFLLRFCNELHLKINIEKLDLTAENYSYRKTLVFLRRFINTFSRTGPLNKYYLIHIPCVSKVSYVLFNYLNKWLRNRPRADTKKVLGINNYKRIVQFYRKSNRKLMEKYNLPNMEKYNYPL